MRSIRFSRRIPFSLTRCLPLLCCVGLREDNEFSEMNRGEGLKIAARAKQGTGLFPEEKKTKKKFTYKSRVQAFPVRKPHISTDSKDLGKQLGSEQETTGTVSQGKSKRPDKYNATKKNIQNNVETKTRPRNSGRKEPSGGRKREAADFIKKNKSVGGSKMTSAEGTSSGVGGADTIALTQEQLNAILQSIGAASGETPVIAIENGQVKVTERLSERTKRGTHVDQENGEKILEEGLQKEQVNADDGRNNKDNDDRSVAASENLLHLQVGGLEIDSNKAEEEPATVISSNMSKNGYNGMDDNRRSGNLGRRVNSSSKNGEFTWGSPVGMGNIGATIGSQRELSAQERKKLEWKKALDEQIAERKRQKEQETVLRRSLDKTETDMFHHKPSRQTEKIDAAINFKIKDPVGDTIVRESSLRRVTDQSHVPAAMRSNFFIGESRGPGTEELKRKEKQEWIQELERQRQKVAEIKEREKRKQQEEDAKIGHWTDTNRPSPRNVTVDNVPSQDVDLTSRLASSVAFNPVDTTDIFSPRQSAELSSARGGFNSLVDPAEQERRDMARKKHAEHMQAVQQQVEEKQRVKREAEECRRREEAIEEGRLAAERENLQKQFDMEKEKQRQKEEAAAAKQRALEEGIFNAQQEALAAKHAKRVQRLHQQGHDSSHLREGWDAQHTTQAPPRQVVHSSQQHQPSPRQVVHSSQQHQPIQRSPPPLVPNGTTQTLTPDSLGTRTTSSSMKDAATSTISDQSTQTGLGIDSLSPGILEAIRQASAGIEYRGGSHSDKEPNRGQKSKRGKKVESATTEESVGRRNKISGSSADVTKPPKHTKNAEQPKWGQNVTKKKISNSDKDLSKVGKGREERRRKRQEELLVQQDRLARRRNSLRKPPRSGDERGASHEVTGKGKGARTDRGSSSRNQSKTGREEGEREHFVNGESRLSGRGSNSKDYYRTEEVKTISHSGQRGGSAKRDSGEVEGDFYPFLRSEDIQLTNRSVTVTPDRDGQVEQLETYVDTNSYTPQPPPQMDPLLNPECLKDTGQRQERILEQLSHLRQGLMMKQREIELGLSPTMM